MPRCAHPSAHEHQSSWRFHHDSSIWAYVLGMLHHMYPWANIVGNKLPIAQYLLCGETPLETFIEMAGNLALCYFSIPTMPPLAILFTSFHYLNQAIECTPTMWEPSTTRKRRRSLFVLKQNAQSCYKNMPWTKDKDLISHWTKVTKTKPTWTPPPWKHKIGSR